MSDYFEKLDRYLAPQEENRFLSGKTTGSEGAPKLSKPIVPISKLGTTFGEKTNGQNSTILSNMIASIRQGTGLLQLAIQTPTNAQVGGGISSVGKTQRQAIKEVIKASEVEWEGLEMPTSNMSNMSGFDPQQGGFNEQKRHDDLRHVRDAIQFAAEIGAGGSIDIWSQEFYRDINDASFKKKDPTPFKDFEGYDENVHAMKMLVDDRTGQAIQLATKHLGGQNNPLISVPKWKKAGEHGVGPNGQPYEPGDYLDAEGNKLTPNSQDKHFIMNRVPEWNEKEKKFESKKMSWTQFKNEYVKQRNQEEGVNYSPEEWWQRIQLENGYSQARAQAIYHTQRYSKELREMKRLIEAKKQYEEMEKGKSRNELIKEGLLVPADQPMSSGGQLLPQTDYVPKSELLKRSIEELKHSMKHTHEASGHADAQAEAVWDNINHIKPVEEFAKEKTWDSYADLGVYALRETKQHNPMKPISVGPELGWPQGYGGHTDEFIEIITGARKKMVNKILEDANLRRQFGSDKKKLNELAKKHIKGVLDTSHLSMWYSHFPKENSTETEEHRLKRFNQWYLKQMDKLAEAEVVGSVQIVDSATGDHRHLAIGEGIFPTVDAVKRLKEKGWDGAILSEGHEEEGGPETGKIQYSLWAEFGASIGDTGYHFGTNRGGNSFGNIYGGFGGAAGYRAPPNYVVGGYSPSNEWKLWSEVPFE